MARRNLHNARMILTGASSGIGWELAKLLAARGARLVLNARRSDRLEQLVQEMHISPESMATVVGDVTDPAIRSQLIQTCVQRFGGIDGLINNAGMGAIGDFAENDEARLRRIMEVNFFAPVELTRLALPYLKEGNKPLVVNVSSVLGHCAVPKKSEYCASKFALHGFNDALRDELLPQGIDVFLLCPSTTQTEFFDVALGDRRQIKWAQGGQSPREVALAATRAMERGAREVILTFGGKMLVWLDKLFPTLAHWLIRKST